MTTLSPLQTEVLTGAGIIVDKDASVNWQVNGVKGDNLHKIGEGTLVVQGTGVNEGGLKVGDGTVVLNQQADSSGHVQAFSVNICHTARQSCWQTTSRLIRTIYPGATGGGFWMLTGMT